MKKKKKENMPGNRAESKLGMIFSYNFFILSF